MSSKFPYVVINPSHDKINVNWAFTTHYNEYENGKLDCYISSFDIYFSAQTRESAENKSRSIMRSFFAHFLGHEDKKGLGKLALELHKRGFKATNDAYVIKQFIGNNIIRAKFNSINSAIPESFVNSNKVNYEEKMDLAV